MKKGLTELVFILDKSGSMSGLEKDTIGGYNAALEKQKNEEGECHLTTVLFDNTYELLHDRIGIRGVSQITEKEYAVGGSTALLDAMGRTINKISQAQQNTAEDDRAEKVVVVIITDGEENASREFSEGKIKALVERRKTEDNWEFIFLGANMDAIHAANSIGISADRAVDYLADGKGTRLSYGVVSSAVSKIRAGAPVSEAHFDEIRRDVKKRGGRS